MFKELFVVVYILLTAPCAIAWDTATTKQYDKSGRYKGYYQASPDSPTTKFYGNSEIQRILNRHRWHDKVLQQQRKV